MPDKIQRVGDLLSTPLSRKIFNAKLQHRRLANLILRTPIGETRNELTNAVLVIQELVKELESWQE